MAGSVGQDEDNYDQLKDEDIDRVFFENSALDFSGFYSALISCGFPDISGSKLSNFIFENISGGEHRIKLPKFRKILDAVQNMRKLYQVYGEGKQFSFVVFKAFLGKLIRDELNLVSTPSLIKIKAMSAVNAMMLLLLVDDEAFRRYDADDKGFLDEADLIIFMLCLDIIHSAFVTMDVEALNKETFPIALGHILGIPSLLKTFQGQLNEAVFQRTDVNKDGTITFVEFARTAMRIVYPVKQFKRLETYANYPGLPCLASPIEVDMICDFVSKLKTGDVILMQDVDGGLGRLIRFSLNTPWSHAAVVVKRTPLTGRPNGKTEEILRQFPFRRNSHRFCSPGYCRCFDSDEGDFAPSRLKGLGDIGLLESTGEGTHIYDLAYRLFESRASWSSMAVVRLHDVLGRDDTAKINAFIEMERGNIYSVAKDELKASIFYHNVFRSNELVLPETDGRSDGFCASLVARFYQHMGWIQHGRKSNSVMPSDFDVSPDDNSCVSCETTKQVLQLKDGWISPPELICSPALEGAILPLKLPR